MCIDNQASKGHNLIFKCEKENFLSHAVMSIEPPTMRTHKTVN